MKILHKIICILYPDYIISLWKRISRKIYNIRISSKFQKIGERVRFDNISFLVGAKYITIGNDSCFGKDLYLTAWKTGSTPSIQIGEKCSFGSWNHISASNKISIGDGLLTGKWVTIVDNSHGTTNKDDLEIRPWERSILSKGPVIIGKNVWLGDKVTILPSVTIGDGCVIAANTVVTKDVPPYSVVAGNPGKVIKAIQ